jgi:hypothetical protein
MKRSITMVACALALLTATSAVAITPGTDLLIAGAARANPWVDDLYINNPNAITVSVDVMWLVRGQANLTPETETFFVGPGGTLILDDVILKTFNKNRAFGAFRVTSTGGPVTANMIALAVKDDENGRRTLGSGFEAIPASAATAAGETTYLMGMTSTTGFRTNLFALGGASGVTMDLDLLDPDGTLLDSAQVVLEAYEPWLSNVDDLWDVGSFANGTARVRVSAGSMVILGSKIDNHPLSEDPTTLEPDFGGGAGSVDGTYQFAIYDSFAFASGGNLVVSDGTVDAIFGTYVNFDKVDGQGDPECELTFQFGLGFVATGVEDFESGVEFTDSYSEGGDITWTMTFAVNQNLGFSGAISAVGSGFTGTDSGCNGTFPDLVLEGGKSN